MTSVNTDQLDSAIRKVALLISQSGEDYWPILERLEAERDALLSRQRRLAFYVAGQMVANDGLREAGTPAPRKADAPAQQAGIEPAKVRSA